MALLQNSKLLLNRSLWKLFKLQPLITSKRNESYDYANTMIGKREYVGFGVNGSPLYLDSPVFPIPAIRFREPTPEICELRKKEECDWKKLSKDEVKKLYRYSFCCTYPEMKIHHGEWKMQVGIALLACALAIVYTFAINVYHQQLPDTFDEDRRQAQLKRIIGLEMNPINGLCSKWDYEIGDWK